jgi:hypothetical protein
MRIGPSRCTIQTSVNTGRIRGRSAPLPAANRPPWGGVVSSSNGPLKLDPKSAALYRNALTALQDSGIPFLVGGAYALGSYCGIERHTKDFDVFVRERDCPALLRFLEERGFHAEVVFTHWLAKVRQSADDDDYIDIIFGSGNGIARVDDEWFEHSTEAEVLGFNVRLCPAEEIVWSKAYIMERERYDGADVVHLIRARGSRFDWRRLMRRMAPHGVLLLAYVVLFDFIYPDDRGVIPAWVVEELVARWRRGRVAPPAPEPRCNGTLLSRIQFLPDIRRCLMRDGRIYPVTYMSDEQIEHWTEVVPDHEIPN